MTRLDRQVLSVLVALGVAATGLFYAAARLRRIDSPHG